MYKIQLTHIIKMPFLGVFLCKECTRNLNMFIKSQYFSVNKCHTLACIVLNTSLSCLKMHSHILLFKQTAQHKISKYFKTTSSQQHLLI